MRITQQDIAKMAGVSQATVSRVLAGDDRVEEAIRDRVMGVVTMRNYRPDMRAKSLRQQRTHLVGLVLKRHAQELAGDPFFSMLISGIIGYLADTPYHLCVDVTDPAGETAIYDEMLRSRRVDGMILVESAPNDERIERLQRDEFPFVVIGNPAVRHVCSVDNDNAQAGEMATRHLLDQGYKRVAILAGPKGLTVSKDRVSGYAKVMAESKLPLLAHYSDFGIDAARDAGRDILSSSQRPDAIVVMDDFMAMGVVQAAREQGLEIGTELGLVSFNDSSVCHVLDHGLTSVSLGIDEMVRACCTALIDLIESKSSTHAQRIIVPCELKARGSSQRTRTEVRR